MIVTTAGSSFPHYLAVDIGGTKVAVAIIGNGGDIIHRLQEPTCQEGPVVGIAQIAALLDQVVSTSGVPVEGIGAVGVGIPAVLAPESDHVIWAPNLQGWRDVALRETLAEQCGLRVFVEYDGHTAVLGEWWAGAGKEYDSVVNIIIGTGIGGGLILDGRLFRGRDRLAGAAGWFAMTAEPTGGDTRSESVGHWESLAAGPGIARRARALLEVYPDSRLVTLGDRLTAKDVFAAAREGDRLSCHIVQETGRLIGLGVANVVSLVNPQIVVLGGSIGCQGDLLLADVQEVVHQWAQPASGRALPIVSSQLGAEAGLLGAAYAAHLRLDAS